MLERGFGCESFGCGFVASLLGQTAQNVLQDGAIAFANLVELDAGTGLAVAVPHVAAQGQVIVGDVEDEFQFGSRHQDGARGDEAAGFPNITERTFDGNGAVVGQEQLGQSVNGEAGSAATATDATRGNRNGAEQDVVTKNGLVNLFHLAEFCFPDIFFGFNTLKADLAAKVGVVGPDPDDAAERLTAAALDGNNIALAGCAA